MSRLLTQYLVFIGSPRGLDEERKIFGSVLERYSKVHGVRQDVTFYPVAWKDTIAGVGRPQELINAELKECDYAVFVLHDRWGTPTGGGYTSGFEEEWALAEQLYREAKVRNIALFFKDIPESQLRDPGEELKKVLAFKRRIEEGRKYLFRRYAQVEDFRGLLEEQLAGWHDDHRRDGKALSHGESGKSGPVATTASAGTIVSASADPGFAYWISEADRLVEAEPPNYASILILRRKSFNGERIGHRTGSGQKFDRPGPVPFERSE